MSSCTKATTEDVPAGQTGIEARRLIRSGAWNGHTSGMAPNHVQGNLVVFPELLANDFLRFCQRNPKSCPLLGVSEPGDPTLPSLGGDLDIRTDIPGYRVWRDGVLVEECLDISHLWQPDLVTFVIGCSFSFEQALIDAGIPLRHIAEGRNVAMYKTNIPTSPAGPFRGPMVASMRPMTAANAIKAVQVTSRMPAAHGAPIHLGDPSLIGIKDLAVPDFGDSVAVMSDEIPVFWACGVTPQVVVMEAKPAFCITHAPGKMLITDLQDHALMFS